MSFSPQSVSSGTRSTSDFVDVLSWGVVEAEAFLDTLDVSVMKLGVERIRRFLDTLGNPQDQIPVVHIAGTNGKGSVVAMLSAVLTAAGYSVGTFTSPHLVSVRERIGVQGRTITAEAFGKNVWELKKHLESLEWDREAWPTYFEFMAALAFWVFAKNKSMDLALVEVGLGGRLDATNVMIHPLLSVVTSIHWDHMDRLGHTLSAIALEKAHIIKPHCPSLMGPTMDPEASQAIQGFAQRVESPLHQAFPHRFEFQGIRYQEAAEGMVQRLRDRMSGVAYDLALLGSHQKDNLSTVFSVLAVLEEREFPVSEEALAQGLRRVDWPGRFQVVPEQRLILDGSHNEAGFHALGETLTHFLQSLPPETGLYWCLSLRKNREPEELIDQVMACSQTRGVVWTVASGKEALYHEPGAMVSRCQQRGWPEYLPLMAVEDALEARDLLQEWTMVRPSVDESGIPPSWAMVTGSLYTLEAFLENGLNSKGL